MATTRNISECDRASKVKAFDASEVDAGKTNAPLMFIHPSHDTDVKSTSAVSELRLPFIDLEGVNENRRSKIIDQVREACENWGFFLLVNHGIPTSVLEETIDGMRRFHEQDAQMKKEFYSRDSTEKVSFVSRLDETRLKSGTLRDSLYWPVAPNPPDPTGFPAVCRDIAIEYSNQVKRLGYTLLELLSEALGLNANHLKDMECAEKMMFVGHYQPPCLDPELTVGAKRHFDSSLLTLLLVQDRMGGLQALHQNQWIDVLPHPGALVIMVGLALQVVTNDRFKALEHRVLVNRERSRVSVATGFGVTIFPSSKLYSPIKELVSLENPPKYEEATMKAHVHNLRGQNV